jgi:hypothetical protein
MKPTEAGSKLSSFFDLEDGGGMSLQNYTALHSRRLYSSYKNKV